MTDVNLGAVNGHAVGRILKEAVRRASSVIRAERLTFEAQTKRGYSGSMDDVFTSADRAAQDVYLRTFRECFPGAGVIGEEAELHIPPVAPVTAYFTVDPLDGTKAFIRRQSHGIAGCPHGDLQVDRAGKVGPAGEAERQKRGPDLEGIDAQAVAVEAERHGHRLVGRALEGGAAEDGFDGGEQRRARQCALTRKRQGAGFPR